MRVAVSGATGYLGSHLIITLLEKGNSVLAITRKMNDALGTLLLKYPLSFSVCELVSDDLLYEIEKFSPQAVYSTTCCYETDVKFLEKTVESNYIFPSKLLKSTIYNNSTGGGYCKFMNISTSLPSSLNLYSLTKKQFSELGLFYSNLGKVKFVNVLLESFYGKDEPENRFIQRSIRGLLAGEKLDVTEGKQTRDYVLINDVIDALVFLGETQNITNDFVCVPLGSGTSPSIREILEYLKVVCKSESKINFGAVPSRANEPSTCADLTALRQLGFTKEMTFWKDGMKKMVEAIKNENLD